MYKNGEQADEIEITGKSESIQKLKSFIQQVAKSDLNVLFMGETGVGKEVAVRMLHHLSHRTAFPFIKFNSAQIIEPLLESELFGHKKGAFTGALYDKSGLIEEARGGTFFFDEISEPNICMQAKLLSVIEEKKIRRVGETKYRPIDVRFIFASNKNLAISVSKGEFRKDFYFRINTLTFVIPPLRERKQDIPLLAQAFLSRSNKLMKTEKKISPAALNELLIYSFPGNVRELENIVHQAIVFSRSDVIETFEIPCHSNEFVDANSIPGTIFNQIVQNGECFWEVVHKPLLQRDLNRDEAKKIIALGLKHTMGSYKKLLRLFNMEIQEKEYKRFMKVIKVHGLKP